MRRSTSGRGGAIRTKTSAALADIARPAPIRTVNSIFRIMFSLSSTALNPKTTWTFHQPALLSRNLPEERDPAEQRGGLQLSASREVLVSPRTGFELCPLRQLAIAWVARPGLPAAVRLPDLLA